MRVMPASPLMTPDGLVPCIDVEAPSGRVYHVEMNPAGYRIIRPRGWTQDEFEVVENAAAHAYLKLHGAQAPEGGDGDK